MSADEKPSEPITANLQPDAPDASQAADPSSEISALTHNLKKLLEKMDVPKRKDVWDVLSVITTFTGTVLIAGISLFVTQSYQRAESDRTRSFQQFEAERSAKQSESQLEIQRAQIRVEELKAITAMAPLLASSDPRMIETGRQLLKAVQESGTVGTAESLPSIIRPPSGDSQTGTQANPIGGSSSTRPVSLFDQFAKIALSSSLPSVERVAAIKKIGDIATAPMSSAAIKARAADLTTQIAGDDAVPPEVQKAAADVLARVKRVSIGEARNLIASEPINPAFNGIVIHNLGPPGAGVYKNEESIPNLAKAVAGRLGWKSVVWHYAIAPDGSIWLGAPLEKQAIHAGAHNKTTLGITLILNGDDELPTDSQRETLKAIINSLLGRMRIGPENVYFHRDVARPVGRTTCPGKLITKEMLLGQL